MTTNFFRKILSDCQTVWIQIRSNLLSGMVWIQTVCKGYQQTTLFLSLFQVGKQFELLNCDKHKSIAKKFKRDIATCRPDITHQVIYTVDFPEPDLGPDIGPFPIEKWAETSQHELYCSQFISYAFWLKFHENGPRSAVDSVSGYRCVSDCRSRGREFDPGPVPYFRGDWSWNDFYGHSPPFRWFIQEGLLSVTSESMCTKYCPGKSVVRWTDRPAMTIAVDLGRKATKQTNKSWKSVTDT